MAEAAVEIPGLESTLAMIKPDAVKAGKAEEICQLIELAGFTIVAKQKLQVGRPWHANSAGMGV